MPLFSSKGNSEKFNPEFVQQLTIGRKVTLQRIGIHLFFWMWMFEEDYFDFQRMLQISPDIPVNPNLHWFMFLTHMSITVVMYYLVGYLVLPSLIKLLVHYYATQRILWANIGFIFISFCLICIFFNVYDYYVFGYAVHHYRPIPGFIERNAKYVYELGPFAILSSRGAQGFIWAMHLSYLLLPSQLRLIRWLTYWGVDNIKKYEQNQKLARNQLKYLQDQVNPHFLLNVLNNLYALIHRTHTEAALLLRRLIDYLRYTLYRTHENFVPLDQELLFIKNYIEIEQSRLRDPSIIRFFQTGNPAGHLIPPLLLMTFIENAFKHGIQSSFKDAWVEIHIDVIEKPARLRLDIKNSVNRQYSNGKNEGGGLGLYNARERLSLLFKHDDYQCVINDQGNVYQVQLEIPLHSSPVIDYEYRSN